MAHNQTDPNPVNTMVYNSSNYTFLDKDVECKIQLTELGGTVAMDVITDQTFDAFDPPGWLDKLVEKFVKKHTVVTVSGWKILAWLFEGDVRMFFIQHFRPEEAPPEMVEELRRHRSEDPSRN